jgi:glycosyltransferase involved in cell wall biosynthesis
MNEAAPIVSIVIPCFNQGRYVDEAVESVLTQTLQSFEIIIVNDGSTDPETVQVLTDYNKPKVQVIHTKNCGTAAARNTAIRQAQGQYILPLDADDRIEKTYLEKAVRILDESSNIGIVSGEVELFGILTGKWELPEYRFPDILLDNVIPSFSFYRRVDWDRVGGYQESMIYGLEDYDFWLSLIELGREFIRIPEILCFYRQVPNSRNRQMTVDQWIASQAQIFRNHPQLYTDHIDTLFKCIFDLRGEVHSLKQENSQSQAQFSQLQSELAQVHSALVETQNKLVRSQNELVRSHDDVSHYENLITAMKSSKFWKMRTQWIRFKQKLGMKSDELAI